jgi:enoyl-CoA hydratase/carnithine racemase
MGHRRAADLLYFGEPFTADTAQDVGIVNTVVAAKDLLNTATAKAQLLAEKPPSALRITKALLKRASAGAIADAMAKETEQFAALLQGPEAKEAMMAFMQRRKTDFSKF